MFNRLSAMSDSATRPDADPEWEALLHQLRTQAPTQPRPYFYGRLQARLAAEDTHTRLPGWLLRPAYALLLGALVLALSGDDVPLTSGTSPVATTSPAPR